MSVKFKLNHCELPIKWMLNAVWLPGCKWTLGGLPQRLKKFQSENLRFYINLRAILVKFLLQAQYIVLFFIDKADQVRVYFFSLEDTNFNSCL
jgi:hypothetical protein